MLRARSLDETGRGAGEDLGIERLSKSQVSRMAKDLDKEVDAFRTRPLDGGPYTYVWLDAMVEKVREAGASSTWPWSSPLA